MALRPQLLTEKTIRIIIGIHDGANRKLISLLILRFFPDVEVVEEFESIHNYISDDNIIRKGAWRLNIAVSTI